MSAVVPCLSTSTDHARADGFLQAAANHIKSQATPNTPSSFSTPISLEGSADAGSLNALHAVLALPL